MGASIGGEEELRELPISEILANPHQPRGRTDEDKLKELAASIREHGVVQPVVVRPLGDRFELVAGERRWRAAQLAGLSVVPAVVRSLNERQALEIALVENLQREDLNPIEQARAFEQLMGLGVTQEQLAARLGLSRPAVANTVRLLQLAKEIQAMVEEGALSAGHARTVAGLPQGEQLRYAREMSARGLNVRQAEELVRGGSRRAARRGERTTDAETDPDLEAAMAQLREALGTEVRVVRSGKGGRLAIRYFSPEDLERLVDLLLAAVAPDGAAALSGGGSVSGN